MNKYLIKISTIPNNIKFRIAQYIYKKSYLVGYKKISSKHKVVIVQLTDNTRIWMLKKEIKLSTKLK